MTATQGQTAARWGLGVLGAVVLVALCWRWRLEIVGSLTAVRPAWIGAAVLSGVGLSVVQGLCFAELMSKNGAAASRTKLVAAFLLSQPGKYIPGKVAGPLMQQLSLGEATSTSITLAANIELAVLLVIQVTGSGLAFAAVARPALAVACLATTLVAATVVLRALALGKLVARLRRRPLADPRILTSSASPSWMRAATLSTVSLVLVSVSSALVIRAFADWNASMFMASLASLFLGYASSIVAFVVPAGLGVREVATAGIGTILPGAPPTAQIVALSILFRCWQLVVDAIATLGGWAFMARAARLVSK